MGRQASDLDRPAPSMSRGLSAAHHGRWAAYAMSLGPQSLKISGVVTGQMITISAQMIQDIFHTYTCIDVYAHIPASNLFFRFWSHSRLFSETCYGEVCRGSCSQQEGSEPQRVKSCKERTLIPKAEPLPKLYKPYRGGQYKGVIVG